MTSKETERMPSCIFCKIISGDDQSSNIIFQVYANLRVKVY